MEKYFIVTIVLMVVAMFISDLVMWYKNRTKKN